MQIEFAAAQLSQQPLTVLPLMFAAGVLTSLTPCVYPMIPITAAIVGGSEIQAAGQHPRPSQADASGRSDHRVRDGESEGHEPAGRWRSVRLTLAYVVGLALVYAILGLIAGLTGSIFGTISANPWAFFLMANVLLIAALAMLDVAPVRLPASLLQSVSRTGRGGRTSGVFAMGAVSGLVAAPCSAPVMAAVLTWVSTTRSGTLGFLYLFAFSLGMSSLLILVGVSSGAIMRLPRAGEWMLRVKQFFALVMLVMAEYYLVKMGQVYF